MSSDIEFQLPGRNRAAPIDPEINIFKATLAKSLAFSRTFNNRNLEFPWYPCWGSTLFDLVADRSNLIVAPQHPLYFSDEDIERWGDDMGSETAEEGCDPYESEGPPPTIAAPHGPVPPPVLSTNITLDDYEYMECDPDASFSTTPGRRVSEVYVDYAIIHVDASSCETPARYSGWQITQMSVPLLVEQKRFASRSLGGPELMRSIKGCISEAICQLHQQAAHLFVVDIEATSVMAIGACGPYWSDMIIERNNIPNIIEQVTMGKTMSKAHLTAEVKANLFARWTEPLLLDTPESNIRFHNIYERLCALGPVGNNEMVS